MKTSEDAYGQQLLAQYCKQTEIGEIIERDDDFIDTGSEPGLYFSEYEQWSLLEQKAINLAKGRVLDIGCGAGRHSLYLQQNGFDVIGIDNSPGAIELCQLRGLKKVMVRAIDDVDKFAPASFDTILMLGNNFGLFGSSENAKLILKKLSQITAPDAQIIVGTRNPYQTNDQDHLQYHESNKKRGKMAGQIRMRVRYRKIVGMWFDYLFVSQPEMQDILAATDWQIKEFIELSDDANYFAVFNKKSSI